MGTDSGPVCAKNLTSPNKSSLICRTSTKLLFNALYTKWCGDSYSLNKGYTAVIIFKIITKSILFVFTSDKKDTNHWFEGDEHFTR